MRTRTILLVVNAAGVLALAAVLVAQAADPLFGTWKTVPAKSTYSPGPAPKNNTKKYEPYKGGVKAQQDLVTAKGETRHVEVTGAFDGKDYPGTGNPEVDTYSFQRVDAHNYVVTQKKGGKVTITSKMKIAADGKSRVVTQTGTDTQGRAVNNSVYWEKVTQ
jgi:hypothetical protein